MEGHLAKRRRVYSLEPSKVVQSMFTRNYVNYLVPALMKIKEKSSTSSAEEDCRECGDLKIVVKYEVDMAMAFSAQGFAWSHGLKAKLQKGHHHHVVNAATSTTTTGEGSSSKIHNHNEMVPEKNTPELINNTDFGTREDDNEEDDDEDEEEMMKRQLRNLRRLIPGGEEMCDDEQMVTELESYISCLQMQVNVLQCLLAETP